MINLLPPEQKKELLEETSLKLTLILGILFLSFLLSLFLILFSVKISIFRDLEVQKAFLEEREKIISLNQNFEKEIKESNLSLSNLDSFYRGKINLIQILEKISGILPPGTYLTNLNFNLFQISLSGFSPTREILLSFKENLESEKEFSEVYFPPENWVKPSDINFSVTFKITK